MINEVACKGKPNFAGERSLLSLRGNTIKRVLKENAVRNLRVKVESLGQESEWQLDEQKFLKCVNEFLREMKAMEKRTGTYAEYALSHNKLPIDSSTSRDEVIEEPKSTPTHSTQLEIEF